MKAGAPSLASNHLTLESADPSSLLRSAVACIDILAPSLGRILTTGTARALETALESSDQLTIRILALDPDSIVANLIAKHLGVPVGLYRERLRGGLLEARELLRAWSAVRCRVRLTDDLLHYYYFRIDNVVLVSPLIETLESRIGMTLQLHVEDPGVGNIQGHFDQLWGGSIPLEAFQGL